MDQLEQIHTEFANPALQRKQLPAAGAIVHFAENRGSEGRSIESTSRAFWTTSTQPSSPRTFHRSDRTLHRRLCPGMRLSKKSNLARELASLSWSRLHRRQPTGARYSLSRIVSSFWCVHQPTQLPPNQVYRRAAHEPLWRTDAVYC